MKHWLKIVGYLIAIIATVILIGTGDFSQWQAILAYGPFASAIFGVCRGAKAIFVLGFIFLSAIVGYAFLLFPYIWRLSSDEPFQQPTPLLIWAAVASLVFGVVRVILDRSVLWTKRVADVGHSSSV